MHIDNNKLIIYAIGISVLSALPTVIYAIYCNASFCDYVRFKFVRNKAKYKDVFSFSVWVGYGAIACIGKSQGAAVLVNMFFNTLMNTAMGIANNVNAMVTMVANTVTQPIVPQLTKAYVAGDYEKSDKLLVLSIKLGYFAMFIIAAPLLVEMEWVLGLWLGEIPQYAVTFSRLMIIDALAGSLNSGISTIIFASGQIRLYQIVINTLRLSAIIAGYFVLKAGWQPESLLITYIIFSIIILFVMQFVLHKTLEFDNYKLFRCAYLPSILLTLFFIPIAFVQNIFTPFVSIILYFLEILVLIYLVGLSNEERIVLKDYFLKVNKFLKSFK